MLLICAEKNFDIALTNSRRSIALTCTTEALPIVLPILFLVIAAGHPYTIWHQRLAFRPLVVLPSYIAYLVFNVCCCHQGVLKYRPSCPIGHALIVPQTRPAVVGSLI